MQFDLTQLEGDALRVQETLEGPDFADLEPDARFQPVDVRLNLTLGRERSGARVAGTFEARVRAECDRCLKPLEIPVSGEFDQRYTWGETAPVTIEDAEVAANELDIERLEEPTLDTRHVAVEQIELNAPVRVVCSELCAGLCPECGADRNLGECGCAESQIDPRWEALRKLKKL